METKPPCPDCVKRRLEYRAKQKAKEAETAKRRTDGNAARRKLDAPRPKAERGRDRPANTGSLESGGTS